MLNFCFFLTWNVLQFGVPFNQIPVSGGVFPPFWSILLSSNNPLLTILSTTLFPPDRKPSFPFNLFLQIYYYSWNSFFVCWNTCLYHLSILWVSESEGMSEWARLIYSKLDKSFCQMQVEIFMVKNIWRGHIKGWTTLQSSVFHKIFDVSFYFISL